MVYRVLGLMSGTSLDGLDMAYCIFTFKDNKVLYSIENAVTVPYSQELKDKIIKCETSDGEYLAYMSCFLGHYFGKEADKFIKHNNLKVDFISSHGQTIFHQPHKGFTLQIGDINSIVSETHCTVIGDFRSLDVALGGQGAPLVPIGDKLLFSEYGCCLNIGGFANISYEENSTRKAFDICPSNIVLNYLANSLNLPYDKDGNIAKNGRINQNLLAKLNSITYYTQNIRQSLGKEWVKANIFPLLQESDISTEDKIATYTEHIAIQISKNICSDTLVTGGGAFNKFLIENIRGKTKHNIIIPNSNIINYKEALIFAFLGVKRMRKEINCLSSVTGACKDCCSGAVVYWAD